MATRTDVAGETVRVWRELVEAAQRARDLLADDWQSGGRWNDYGGGEVGAALDAALYEAGKWKRRSVQ